MSESRIKERRFRYRVTHSRLAAWTWRVRPRARVHPTLHARFQQRDRVSVDRPGLGWCGGWLLLVRTDIREIRRGDSSCARSSSPRALLRMHRATTTRRAVALCGVCEKSAEKLARHLSDRALSARQISRHDRRQWRTSPPPPGFASDSRPIGSTHPLHPAHTYAVVDLVPLCVRSVSRATLRPGRDRRTKTLEYM